MLTPVLSRNTTDTTTTYPCLLAKPLSHASAGTAAGSVRHVHQDLQEFASDAKALIASGTTPAATKRTATGASSVEGTPDYESCISPDFEHGRTCRGPASGLAVPENPPIEGGHVVSLLEILSNRILLTGS